MSPSQKGPQPPRSGPTADVSIAGWQRERDARRTAPILAALSETLATMDIAGDLVGQILGPYRIERELGRGGMGVVYQGINSESGQRVAIKVMLEDQAAHPEFVARFKREITVLNRLDHPHIVRLYDAGESADHRLYFVTEFIEGPSLRSLMGHTDTLSENYTERYKPTALAWNPRIQRILEQIVDALEAAHRPHQEGEGIVHRDIKPENILLVTGTSASVSNVKLIDFGMAKRSRLMLSGGGDSIASITFASIASGSGGRIDFKAFGTLRYTSPEILNGSDKIDGRSDLYSLGCIMYEMFTGRPAFDAPSEVVLLVRILGDARPEPPRSIRSDTNIPEPVERVIMQLLECDPDKRPTHAQIKAALRGESLSSSASAPVPATTGPSHRIRNWAFAGIGFALATAGIATAVHLSSRPAAVQRRSVTLQFHLPQGAKLSMKAGKKWIAVSNPAEVHLPSGTQPVEFKAVKGSRSQTVKVVPDNDRAVSVRFD